MLPPRFQDWAKETGVPRAVADYIAGMTDRYCQDEYRKLFNPFENIL
jgi:dGTPase